MKLKKKEEVAWLEFDLLSSFPEIVHGVFLRHGGVSLPPFDSLNMTGSEDTQEFLIKNHEIVQNCLQVREIVFAKERHGTNIEVVPISHDTSSQEGYDALVTNDFDIGLVITHADCQAAIFYDPIRHVIANVHCGWKGSVQNIYKKTISFLKSRMNVDPKNLHVCISPSLGPKASEFIHYLKELPESFYRFQVKPNYFDFWAISRFQLESEGVLPHHIEIAEICTYSDSDNFFSYRREKKLGRKTGRHATIVALKR